MAKMQYLDFDLHLERSEKGYRAEVVACPAGQASVEFEVPFSDLEVENLLLRLGRPRQGIRRVDLPEMEAAKNFGARLFETVFDGDVRACLRSSLDEAMRQNAGLRIRLHFAETPELANWPWEYLYNPALNRFFSLSIETPLVRYLDLPERIRPLSIRPPLQVLVMISSPNDYDALDVEGEWAKLQEALGDLEQRGLVALERLEEATLAALQQQLRQDEVHVLHFIGHGGFSERREDGALILEDEQGRGRRVSGQDLGILLHDHRSLRLAILNACEGARTSCNDPFAGTAQSLVQQGIPAVIGMQFPVTDAAAITLAHEFYGALADGYPVDASLSEARKAIFAQGYDTEWGTPVLYMRSPDGVLFDLQNQVQSPSAPIPAPRPQRVPAAPEQRAPAAPARWPRKLPAVVWVLLALIVLAGGGLALGKAIGWPLKPTPTPVQQAVLPSSATPVPVTTQAPTPIPTAKPTEAQCAIAVDPRLPLSKKADNAGLGCAAASGAETFAAFQPFERGVMFWREDLKHIYVLQNDGTWSSHEDTWTGSYEQVVTEPDLSPPRGLYAPVRGFGQVWRLELGGPPSPIGWGTGEEQGYTMVVQPFARGLLLNDDDDKVYALYDDDTWQQP